MVRKICVVTGSRSEYGLLRPVIDAISKHSGLSLQILVTGMHLQDNYGLTKKEILDDGYKISAEVPMTDDSMSRSLGRGVTNISVTLEYLRPDILLVLGDRIEALAATMAASYMNIPVAHIHGGDKTMGGIDESARHAITKMAHIHFPATRKSAERIRKLGEDKCRIHMVGSPAIDEIKSIQLYTRDELSKRLGTKLDDKFLLVVQHPVSTDPSNAGRQMRETLAAIKKVKIQSIIIYPNSDSGAEQIIEAIESEDKLNAFISVSHKAYLSLLKYASILIGNSSSGMTESSSFKLPVINIGDRQNGRERAGNVVDVGYDRIDISNAIHLLSIRKIVSKMGMKNPYGNGTAGIAIAKILANTRLDKLLDKQITYR